MADDIDDLLREVEEKFLPQQASKRYQGTNNNNFSSSFNKPSIYSDTARSIAAASVVPIAGAISSSTAPKTTRAHSSDILCHELDDDLSDLLDDGGRLNDAALVGLRCKRSPRRSASARELMTVPSSSSANSIQDERFPNNRGSFGKIGQPIPLHRAVFTIGESSDISGNRSAPPGSVSSSTSSASSTKGTFNGYPLPSSYVPSSRILTNATYKNSASSLSSVYNSSDLTEKQKCFPIYLSGVIDSIDSNQSVRVCNSLRCSGCDFRVSQFAHYRWRPGTDHLFLRNHMPEFDRVRVKLAAAKFCRAYACQCKFVTVKDLVDLNKLGPEFATKWICLGH